MKTRADELSVCGIIVEPASKTEKLLLPHSSGEREVFTNIQ